MLWALLVPPALATATAAVPAPAPARLLSMWWSPTNQDNYVVGSAAGRADAAARRYKLDSNDDGVAMPQSGSSLVLSTWWSETNKDMMLTGSAQGVAWAAKRGYKKLRVEAYSASESGGPTFVQGSQMISTARHDTVLAFTDWQKHFLGANGYTELWKEGWLDSSAFPPGPPPPGPPGPPPGPPGPPHPQCVPQNVYGWREWPQHAPFADNPFAQSPLYSKLEFDGLFAVYGNGARAADTFYPVWSKQGKIYSTYTDGTVDGLGCGDPGGAVVASVKPGSQALLGGFCNLTTTNKGCIPGGGSGAPFYPGRYPAASMYFNGTWMIGTYGLGGFGGKCTKTCSASEAPANPCPATNYPLQGPFFGWHTSTDEGSTWQAPGLPRIKSPADSLFKEPAVPLPGHPCFASKPKFGALHVVDHGPENENSPDGKVYLIGHGSSDPLGWLSWMQGSEVYMARFEITNVPSELNDPSRYEFWGGESEGWVRTVAAAKPVLTWANRTGVTTQTYVPALKKYLTVVSTPSNSPQTQANFTTYILESDAPTGPFKMVKFLRDLGPEAYFVNFPSGFMAKQKAADGSFEAVLSWSQNWNMHNVSNPPGTHQVPPYDNDHFTGNWVLQHVRLSTDDEDSLFDDDDEGMKADAASTDDNVDDDEEDADSSIVARLQSQLLASALEAGNGGADGSNVAWSWAWTPVLLTVGLFIASVFSGFSEGIEEINAAEATKPAATLEQHQGSQAQVKNGKAE